ncbi:hypothetical protein HPG69_010734, partial [Diceros bicornis minor]
NSSEIDSTAMERRPEPVRGKLQIFQKMDTEPQAGAGSPVLEYHTALVTGDLDRLEALMDQFFQDANMVFEIKKDEMEWQVKSSATFGPSGLWTLEYKRELTTPLCIAAARGHTACVSHLIARGAHPDASPGGRGALHEACLGGHTACVQLLLRHRADPDLLSAEGLAPLHLCRTAASLGPGTPPPPPPRPLRSIRAPRWPQRSLQPGTPPCPWPQTLDPEPPLVPTPTPTTRPRPRTPDPVPGPPGPTSGPDPG